MFVGLLVQLRSERFVGFCGTSFTIIGLLICAFSTNTPSLAVGYGLVFGIGIGLVGTNGILIISKYFRKKIVLAFALFASAVGVVVGGGWAPSCQTWKKLKMTKNLPKPKFSINIHAYLTKYTCSEKIHRKFTFMTHSIG